MRWAITEEGELPLVEAVPGVDPVTESLPQPQPPGGLVGVENPLPRPGVGKGGRHLTQAGPIRFSLCKFEVRAEGHYLGVPD